MSSRLNYLSHPPTIHPISAIVTPKVSKYISTHNISVYEITKKGCGVVMIDVVFRAGRPQEAKKMLASSVGSMLREGAGKYNAHDLSEEIDFLGATLITSTGLDFITIKAVFLKNQIAEIIELVGAIIRDPRFDKDEWKHFKQKSKERLKVQLAKNDIKSYRAITEEIYGRDHPYGYNSSPKLYDSVKVEELRAHHEDFMKAQNCQIFVSGDIEYDDRKYIDQLCSFISEGGKRADLVHLPDIKTKPRTVRLQGGSRQSSIRMGRRAVTRNHEDFDGLNYLCNILGGYFGSRLISKIREERGLTYSIYCTLDSHIYDGDIMISTEVANENVGLCIEEIYNQIEAIREELVEDRELELVNNYLMGNYLNLFDGPFNSIRAIKSLALAHIPLDDIDTLIKSSLSFNAYQIRDMARKYFDRNDFWNVIVGISQSE